MTSHSTETPQPTWLAPAKLNLFLHITGRRDDGYHQLQTVFQFVDLSDELIFHHRDDTEITLLNPPGDWASEADLSIRAARLLQPYCETTQGVTIERHKRIPAGAGLGGGSSDAATTLIALNQLWNLNLSRDQLAQLGLTLGADVPVFIIGHSAWAEGVGEKITPIQIPERWYLIVIPDCHVSTAEIFGAEQLTRNSPAITIRAYLAGETAPAGNDCLAVVLQQFPAVKEVYEWLRERAEVRLSGTGAALFCEFTNLTDAIRLKNELPGEWQHFLVRSMTHPHCPTI